MKLGGPPAPFVNFCSGILQKRAFLISNFLVFMYFTKETKNLKSGSFSHGFKKSILLARISQRQKRNKNIGI